MGKNKVNIHMAFMFFIFYLIFHKKKKKYMYSILCFYQN